MAECCVLPHVRFACQGAVTQTQRYVEMVYKKCDEVLGIQ